MTTYTYDDLLALKESLEVEFKKAVGREGRGEVPREFWPTYSAMANTEGGEIFLGIEELGSGALQVHDLPAAAALRQDIFNLAHNKQKISANLLRDEDVEVLQFDGRSLLRVVVPRASRRQRPIFVGENPLRGTYERRNEGDYLVPEDAVRRMLAEQIDAPRDATVLSNFSVEDLDLDSVNSYRQIFSSRAPTHPFIAQSLPDFLRSIQAWKKDRESGEEGLTLAGLLMFGRLNAILDAVPNYIVDYQERPEARTEARWIDRVTTDGSWSGNLFDFYRRVIAKLTADLKAPFRLEAMVRQGVTPVHEALQEALVNALIHADFSGRVSVLVVKRPDMYGFRNPGLMRVPIEQVIRGGDSDCRNRLIQKMFQLVGAGDQAGSGVPRIFGVWKDQSWRLQVVHEKRDPDQTLFERRMASLLPAAVVADLENSYGERFLSLDATEKLVVVTAAVEGFVDHKRVREITDEHPADITKTLSKLSRDGYLNQSGHGRGTIYRSAGYVEEGTDLLTGPFGTPAGVDPSPRSLPEVQGASTSAKLAKPLDLRSGGSEVRSGGSKGRSGGFVETTGAAQRAEEALSRLFPAGLPSKMAPENMRLLILDVLSEAALSIKELSSLLNRAPDFLRAQHVRPLVAEGLLESEFPDRPNHPAQRYRTKRSAAT